MYTYTALEHCRIQQLSARWHESMGSPVVGTTTDRPGEAPPFLVSIRWPHGAQGLARVGPPESAMILAVYSQAHTTDSGYILLRQPTSGFPALCCPTCHTRGLDSLVGRVWPETGRPRRRAARPLCSSRVVPLAEGSCRGFPRSMQHDYPRLDSCLPLPGAGLFPIYSHAPRVSVLAHVPCRLG